MREPQQPAGQTRRRFLALVLLDAMVLLQAANVAAAPVTELERLVVKPLPWLTGTSMMPAGTTYEAAVPDTLDLAEVAREAVHGLTAFLDDRMHCSGFGHGVFATQPPCLIHDQGQDQNWGKVLEALALARAMSGSREHLDRQRASMEAMLSYAELKSVEPYPVPLARILMAADALHRYCPHPELPRLIARQRDWLTARIQQDEAAQQAYFGPATNRWTRDDKDIPMGIMGHSLNVFTGGSVLRALVRADTPAGGSSDTRFARLLRNGLMDARYWDAPQSEALTIPSTVGGHGRFAGHHHSHTAALLGLLYYGHAQRDAEAIEFVRKSYENLRTFGLARIGLFGEGCTAGDMTYLAVRLSQWGAGDYWEDVDQYVRNHLTEIQLRDTTRLAALVREKGRALAPSELGDWAQGLDTNNVVARCRGLFWSDATHPTLIPIREDAPAAATCLQWVVCCSGNCTKALHEVWSGMLEHDPASRFTRVHLLLNRASTVLDVESHLPHEGKVELRVKQTSRLAVRIPRWVDQRRVECATAAKPLAFSWLGNYLMLPEVKRGQSVVIRFPMNETTETVDLAWRLDQFWLESTQPSASWRGAKPTRFTLTFRGNTLADIQPRDTRSGYPLYSTRSVESLHRPAATKTVRRFVPAPP